MIQLKIEGYCHSCLDFSPDVTKAERVRLGDDTSYSDTTIQCKYRKRCEAIRRFLEHKIKEEVNSQ